MSRPLVAVALLLAPAPALSLGEYVNEAWGFRIDPPRRWTATEQPGTSDASFAVHFAPPKSSGKVVLKVEARPSLDETPDSLLELAREIVEQGAPYSNVEAFDTRIDGRSAPGIRVHYTTETLGTFVIQQSFVISNGMRYSLTGHAPLADFDKRARELERAVRSFRPLRASDATLAERRLVALASRCGTEVDWAKDWEAAAARARDEDRMVLVLVRYYPGFTIPDLTPASTFMDPDIVELVNARFVPLRFEKGAAAPFVEPEVYGMSATTFGTALLVVSPEGRVLRETHAWHPSAVYELLLDAIGRHPEYAGPDPPSDDEPASAASAQRLIARGELERAAQQIAALDGLERLRAEVSIARRRRDGESALRAIRAAREAGAENDVALGLEEAHVLLRLERNEATREALETLRPLAEDDARAQIDYRLAVVAQNAGRHAQAADIFDALIAEHPQSRWAWKAAALRIVLRNAPEAHVRTGWPADDVLSSLRRPDPEPLAPERASDAARDAVALLLAEQREDGSWVTPSQLNQPSREAPNAFAEAITAISGMALVTLDTDAARAAVERAIAYLIEANERSLTHESKPSYMDYSPYSDAWTLAFFSDCIGVGVGDRRALERVMADRVDHLETIRQSGGGWSYYLTGDISGEVTAADQSISFVTALVTLGLQRATDVGFAPARRLLPDALDCLERMRNDDGTFIYMLYHADETAGRGKPVGGAAGRGPLCELALLRGGRSTVEQVHEALDIFMRHRDGLANEVGKSLMHAGPDGQGAHYVLFDYAFAAAAVRVLPAEQRGPHRVRLLELILATRSEEGGFRDTSINGWAYGTAMALLAFRSLSEAD